MWAGPEPVIHVRRGHVAHRAIGDRVGELSRAFTVSESLLSLRLGATLRDEDPKLLEELAASAEDEAAGYVIDFEAVIAPLGVKRKT